jgi:hypothetical protein
VPEIFVDRLFEVARALDENALGRQRPHETAELMQTGGHGVRTKFAPVRCPFRAYLHRIQQWQERVSRYFWAPSVKYAGI